MAQGVRRGEWKGVERGEGEMKRGKGSGARLDRVRGEARERARKVLCNGSGDINGEHLGCPLGREMGVIGGAQGVIGMGSVPDGINAREEMRRDRRRGGKLEGREGSGVRDSVRRRREAIIGPWGSRSWRVVKGGKEEEFSSKVAESAEGVEGEGE